MRTDERGRFYYVGRKQEVIRRSGETISAAEVEEVLLTHPAVHMCAGARRHASRRGQGLRRFAARLWSGDSDPEQLADHCLERLAYFKEARYWD